MARYAGAAPFIYFNGQFVPDGEAKVDVLSAAVKYAALVFEGMVAHVGPDDDDVRVFRLPEHIARLQRSMRVLRFAHDYTDAALAGAVLETLRHNEVRQDAHIRLAAFVEGRGSNDAAGPIGLSCSVAFRPAGGLEQKAVRCAVSSWRRIDDASLPPRVKSAANYGNSRLGVQQARADGYDEAIFLNAQGKVAEAGSSCLFVLRDGRWATPMATHGILESITRDSLLALLSGDDGRPVAEREIDRSELYLAEEAFLCGSAYEVTPILSVDGLPLGDGAVGPRTRRAWALYEAALRGRDPAHRDWLTPVYGAGAGRRAAGG